MTVVRVRELVHSYGEDPVLCLPKLDVDPGTVHLAGPNGAGKSTLLALLATLVAPDRGRIQVLGYAVEREPDRVRAATGYVGHEVSLHGALPARQALDLHARLHEVEPEQVDHALEAWGLGDRAGERVDRLSHGQRRRLDLARALLHEPDVVLLDEPVTGLDERARDVLIQQLADVDPELVLVASPQDPGLATDDRIRLGEGRLEVSS